MKWASITVLAIIAAFLAIVAGYAYTNPGAAQAISLHAANKLGISEKSFCFFIPNEEIAFDRLETEDLKLWNKSVRFATNPQHLSVSLDNERDRSVLVQRFVPSEKGSERAIVSVNVDGRTSYELRQSVFFEKEFDWGQESKSGKFGFGLGGGSAPSGGDLAPDGFTVRPVWRGREDGEIEAAVYVYSADRTQNLPYGDEFAVPGFRIPKGEWFDVNMRITMNSELDKSDGELSISINDEHELTLPDIQWQSEGEKLVIDRLLFSSFHGGNSTSWSPKFIVQAKFTDACLYN